MLVVFCDLGGRLMRKTHPPRAQPAALDDVKKRPSGCSTSPHHGDPPQVRRTKNNATRPSHAVPSVCGKLQEKNVAEEVRNTPYSRALTRFTRHFLFLLVFATMQGADQIGPGV